MKLFEEIIHGSYNSFNQPASNNKKNLQPKDTKAAALGILNWTVVARWRCQINESLITHIKENRKKGIKEEHCLNNHSRIKGYSKAFQLIVQKNKNNFNAKMYDSRLYSFVSNWPVLILNLKKNNMLVWVSILPQCNDHLILSLGIYLFNNS